VLKKFVDQFSPSSWAGSRAAIVESNTNLLNKLEEYPDPEVRQFIAKVKIGLSEAVTAERQYEAAFERDRDERFE